MGDGTNRLKHDIANKQAMSDGLRERAGETGDDSLNTEADRQDNERAGLANEVSERKSASDDNE